MTFAIFLAAVVAAAPSPAVAADPAVAPVVAPVTETATAAGVAPAPAVVADPSIAVPALTRVVLELVTAVTTRTAKPGDAIEFRLRQPLLVGDRVLMPAGATVAGQVVHSQKAGGFGKAGELLLAARFMEANGVRINLRSLEPIRGADRTRSAMVLSNVPYVGLFAGFVRGGEIEVPAATPFVAKVARPVPFAVIDLAALPLAPVAVVDAPVAPAADVAAPAEPVPAPVAPVQVAPGEAAAAPIAPVPGT